MSAKREDLPRLNIPIEPKLRDALKRTALAEKTTMAAIVAELIQQRLRAKRTEAA